MAGASVARGRAGGRELGDRSDIHPWNRLTHPGGNQGTRRRVWRKVRDDGAMNTGRRVVITGIGAITPIGTGVEGLWEGLRRRESAVRCLTRFDPSMFKSRIAGEAGEFSAADHMEERRARRLDRFSQFSVAATRMALADAELNHAREDSDRVGAMMGTALGGV